MKIDGKLIAQNIFDDLKQQTEELKKENITPHLAIILVGDDPASVAYVNQKKIKAEKIGAKTTIYHLESKIQNSELIELIEKLNNDKNIHGIIVQQPLPQQIDTKKITQLVDPKKDVDGFHSETQFEMPIAMAVLEILKNIYLQRVTRQEGLPTARNAESTGGREKSGQDPQEWLKSKTIVVIGKGETGGKPVANSLRKIGANPTIIDSRTMNPELLTKKADIIICAVGKPNILRPKMIKKGVILISIGISRGENAKLTGDYDQNGVKNIASFYTPTPGGVGPVNVAMLLKNLVEASRK